MKRAQGVLGEPCIVVVGCLVVSACGGGGEPLTADNVGQKYAETFCAARSRCCETQGHPMTPGQLDTCLGGAAGIPLRWGVTQSDREFNADIAQQCLNAAARYDCTNRGMIELDACLMVFTGHTPIGSACGINNDCEQDPDAHALCSRLTDSATCVAANLFQGEGAACGDDFECDMVEGLWCMNEPVTTFQPPGTCVKRQLAGVPCGAGPSWECADGLYCNGIAPHVCAPQQPVGSSCGSNGDTYSCVDFSTCTNGVCAPPPAICLD